MHMSDALITPVIGGTALGAGGGLIGYCVRAIEPVKFEQKLPLMGVMGAFLFAAQMINFSIPGTGSSGHIGGGLLLSIILGPEAGFITMACVLLIQALFFADGGLLAFGCNLINMGFFTAFVAYPFIFRRITAKGFTRKSLMVGSVIATVIGLQLGAFGVVIETCLSGRTELPFGTFILFMQPIHLAIGLVEGVITGLIVSYIYGENRQMIYGADETVQGRSKTRVIVTLMVSALLIGGVISLFASSDPDGLEWAIFNTAGTEEVSNTFAAVQWLQGIQERLSPMPDYSVEGRSEVFGTSFSGLVGSGLTLLLAVGIGLLIKLKRKVAETVE